MRTSFLGFWEDENMLYWFGVMVIRKYGKWGRGGQKIIHDQG
jgi:hypothetical protein